jgi:hypothetical protein
MRKIGYDQFKIDQTKIVEDSKCCLKVNAVISKAGVYLYEDGWALKPKMELLKASNAIRYAGAKLTLHKHPDSKVIMSQSQLYGGLEKPYFERDRIRATLNFDKAYTPSPLLQNIRESVAKKVGLDVSIGFYYNHDPTPGFAADVNTGTKRRYDYVMRDILIDHVAVMFDGDPLRGRCTYPNCGIGVDTMMCTISYGQDIVGKRGNEWCVFHCHPDGTRGGVIKCFPTKAEAEAMHRAIQAQQHGASQGHVSNLKKRDQDEKPPKDWMDKCKAVVKEGKPDYTEEQVKAVCGNIWHHKPEQKGIGDAFSVLTGLIKKRRKKAVAQPLEEEEVLKDLSEEETRYPERSEAFRECVRVRMEEGMTRGEAEAHCEAATLPSDEPAPPPGETGTAQEEETPFDKCVKAKIAEGLSRQEAEAQCRKEHPVAEEDQEVEQTPLERCIAEQMDAGKTEEEARAWCEAELAGEHEQATDLIERSVTLRSMKEQQVIEKQRQSRRQPI